MSRPVCLVTGSSSGIGAAIVEQFAARDYDVVINYNSGEDRAEDSTGGHELFDGDDLRRPGMGRGAHQPHAPRREPGLHGQDTEGQAIYGGPQGQRKNGKSSPPHIAHD